MKIKIFHVYTNFYPVFGGIESFIYQSSKELIKKGYDITVVTSDTLPNKKTKLPAEENIDGIKIRRFPFKKFSKYNTSVQALKFILDSDFDILHIHTIGFFSDVIQLIKFKSNKKVIFSTHGGIFHTKSMLAVKKIYFNTMVRIAGKFADKIIAVSDQDRKFMKKIVDKKKISVIGHGVAWQRLSKIKRNGNGKTLIHFGRMASNKRIDKILHVVSILKKSIKDVRFFVVGADWGELKKLEALTNKLGIQKNVIFTGEVSEKKLYQIMSKSDLFVLASEYEGFGISVIEAMAARLPVVVNNIDTMKEIVKNGKNGYIVDFRNYNQTAKTILKILKNRSLLRKLGNEANAYTKRFDWSNAVKSLEKVYGDLMK
jgi:alpha-1,3-mannosyltransferase